MSPAEAMDKLQKLTSMQEKCSADVVMLLKRWGIAPEHYPDILNRLKEHHFIDDRRFAAAFVRDKILFDHWGFIKINYFLRQKGIPEKMIGESFATVDRDEYASMIRRELGKKKKTLKGPPREIWVKLARYGTSRGYEMDLMHGFLDEIAREE